MAADALREETGHEDFGPPQPKAFEPLPPPAPQQKRFEPLPPPAPQPVRLVLEGSDGKSVVVEGNLVKIVKKSLFGGKDEKVIPIQNIAGVNVEQMKFGKLSKGYIQFMIGAAGKAHKKLGMGGAVAAGKDANSVRFSSFRNSKIAMQMKAYIEQYVAPQDPQLATTAVSTADEIRKWKALLDDGIINQEEFEQKKKILLGL
jgi:hypothetical protein